MDMDVTALSHSPPVRSTSARPRHGSTDTSHQTGASSPSGGSERSGVGDGGTLPRLMSDERCRWSRRASTAPDDVSVAR